MKMTLTEQLEQEIKKTELICKEIDKLCKEMDELYNSYK